MLVIVTLESWQYSTYEITPPVPVLRGRFFAAGRRTGTPQFTGLISRLTVPFRPNQKCPTSPMCPV
eukprot:9749733-Ditylum_brightwellii.AAC.1